jgi:hypothetical protein
MNFCMNHWEKLKDAIKIRDLWQFVSGDGVKATAKIKQQIAGDSGVQVFDPLLNANFAIWNNALEMVGPYLISLDPETNEPYCPICESLKHNGPDERWFIDNACDEQLNKAKELGLIVEVKPS